jgi:hypothetical protein
LQGTGGRGGQGWRQLDQQLFASLTGFLGGRGGWHWHGGDGGDALEVQGAQAELLSNVLSPGFGSHGNGGGAGQDGHAQAGGGVFDFLSVLPRSFAAPVLVPDTGTMAVTVYGQPRDRVWIVGSPVPVQRFVPALGGLRLIRAPAVMTHDPQGIIPASGRLDLQLPMVHLPPGTQVGTSFFQGIVKDVNGNTVLCGPMDPTILNCGALLPDCNGNAAFDTCDILEGVSRDCDGNNRPDECEPDCNGNGVADACDISSGTSVDLNHNGIPDECESSTRTWYIDSSAPAGGDGSALSPFRTIVEGTAAAISGNTILVSDGIYTGSGNQNLSFGGRNLVVRSVNGPASCIIDCQLAAYAFQIDRFETSAAVIEGFTIRNGSGTSGAGIRVMNADVTIADCVFVGCHSDYSTGGGLALTQSASEVKDCVFQQNQADEGGGLSIDFGSPRIHRCLFQDNVGLSSGGGLIVYGDPNGDGPLISECQFLSNHATAHGGGLEIGGPFATTSRSTRVVQCLIAGNTAGYASAVMGLYGRIELRDSTLADNQASTTSTIFVRDPGDLRCTNSILWGNNSPDGLQATLSGTTARFAVSYTEFQGGQAGIHVDPGSTLIWGAGNLDGDPLFVDPDGPDNNPLTFGDNDYRLGPASICLDAGDNDAVPPDVLDLDGDGNTSEATPLDLDGNPRFVDQPGVPDTGHGTPPIVDIGSYERP